MPEFSLQPLLDLMKEKNDEATRRLGQLIAAENNEKKRLQMLENYRTEYATKFVADSKMGLSQMMLLNYRDFLARIDEAITAQTAAVAKSEENTAQGKKEWQKQNTKMKAINTLKGRFDKQNAYLENKREQKMLDEFSCRSRPKNI